MKTCLTIVAVGLGVLLTSCGHLRPESGETDDEIYEQALPAKRELKKQLRALLE